MYAHQVIEDTEKYIPEDRLLDMYASDGTLQCKLKMPRIENAIKFHFDQDLKTLGVSTNTVTKEKGETCWSKSIVEQNKEIKMPYREMWVECPVAIPMGLSFEEKAVHCNKMGVLITETEEYRAIIPYYHNVIYKYWVMDQVLTVIGPSDIKFCWLDYSGNGLSGFNKNLVDKIIDEIGDAILCAISCLKLLNCKNIQSELIKAPAKLNAKRIRNNKLPIFDYHVLNVVIPSPKGSYSAKTEPLSHNRVHLCRGHFKEYTAEHPLFGRLTGLYWWQPHVRGQNKDGIVIKDYNIKAA